MTEGGAAPAAAEVATADEFRPEGGAGETSAGDPALRGGAHGWHRTAAILLILGGLAFGTIVTLDTLDVRSTSLSANITAELASVQVGSPGSTGQILLRGMDWFGDPLRFKLPAADTAETAYLSLEGGPFTLPSLRVDEGAVLTITSIGGAASYELLASGAPQRVEVLLPPGSVVDAGDGRPETYEDRVRSLILEGGAWFRVAGIAVRRERFLEGIDIRGLSFWREASETRDARLSMLREGLLVLDDVDGRRIELREGEPLELEGVDGTLRSLVLDDGLVRVQFDGRVGGIRSGYAPDARSLMPTRLERLTHLSSARAMLAVLTIAVGLLELWKHLAERAKR